MDNASKALIIAGAVLIAVMLVSVGVAIYQQAQGVVDQGKSSMAGLEVTMANAKYSMYEKKGQSRREIEQLLNQVAQGYAQNDEHTVIVNFKSISPAPSQAKDRDTALKARDVIKKVTNHTFDVETKTDKSGYIYEMTVTCVTK